MQGTSKPQRFRRVCSPEDYVVERVRCGRDGGSATYSKSGETCAARMSDDLRAGLYSRPPINDVRRLHP